MRVVYILVFIVVLAIVSFMLKIDLLGILASVFFPVPIILRRKLRN